MPLPPDATPRRRAEILRAVAEVADKMSAATPWRASCGDSLAILGHATGAGRVTLQEASPVTSGEAAGGERLEWFASGTAAWTETATPATDNAVDDAWERELSEGRTFFGDRDELAACERHRLELRRTASIILCPVFTGGRRWGTLAFDLFAEPKRWNREEIDTLALAARVIGAAFAAQQRGEGQAGTRVSHDAATEKRSAHIARLSHELRTSLSAMIGLAYLANQGGAADPHAAHLRKIERVGRTLLSGINTILDFSKIEANAVEIDQEPFSLATVLAGVESVLRPLVRKQGRAWRVEVEPGSPAGLVGDAARLEQVLTHLATNAVKFTHTGTVCVRVAVESSGPLRSTLRFEVTDTGVGMTDELAAAVFEGRRGAKSGGAGSFGGPGLGLMITKSLV
ncbi:MAG: sensor histidine kinase, partial [Opitutaceae bacterium]